MDWSDRNEIVTRMQAGPLGQLLQKLISVGMPPQIGEYAKFVAGAEPKDIEKAMKEGQLPPFMDFLKQLMSGQQEDQGAMAGKQVELRKLQADVEKAVAERDLLIEKTLTEKVDQQVKLAGVQFDEETMKLQRAKLVADIEREAADRHAGAVKTGLDFVSKQNNRPGFNEKGKKSDNLGI